MGIFSKKEIIETELLFEIEECHEAYNESEEGELGGLIEFEAYGSVFGDENRYYYAMVGCRNIEYRQFVDTLVNMEYKKIKVIVKVKNGRAKRFKIDFKDLAYKLNDKNFEKLFMADGWISDRSSIMR